MTTIRSNGCIEFKFFRPGARDVRLAGDFNDWDGRSIRMQPDGQGWWTALLNLCDGEYRFRYLADGTWYTDYASHGVEPGRYGWNSVLFVPPDPHCNSNTDPDAHLRA